MILGHCAREAMGPLMLGAGGEPWGPGLITPDSSFFVLSSSPRGPKEVVSRLRENLASSQGQVKVPDSLGELGPPRRGHRINLVPAGEVAGSRAGKNAPSIR